MRIWDSRSLKKKVVRDHDLHSIVGQMEWQGGGAVEYTSLCIIIQPTCSSRWHQSLNHTRSLPNRANIVLLRFPTAINPVSGFRFKEITLALFKWSIGADLWRYRIVFGSSGQWKLKRNIVWQELRLGGGGELRTFVLSRFTALLLNVLGLLFSAYCNYSREKTNDLMTVALAVYGIL